MWSSLLAFTLFLLPLDAADLTYSALAAGSYTGRGSAVSVDNQGFVYTAGTYAACDFPTTSAAQADAAQCGLRLNQYTSDLAIAHQAGIGPFSGTSQDEAAFYRVASPRRNAELFVPLIALREEVHRPRRGERPDSARRQGSLCGAASQRQTGRAGDGQLHLGCVGRSGPLPDAGFVRPRHPVDRFRSKAVARGETATSAAFAGTRERCKRREAIGMAKRLSSSYDGTLLQSAAPYGSHFSRAYAAFRFSAGISRAHE